MLVYLFYDVVYAKGVGFGISHGNRFICHPLFKVIHLFKTSNLYQNLN